MASTFPTLTMDPVRRMIVSTPSSMEMTRPSDLIVMANGLPPSDRTPEMDRPRRGPGFLQLMLPRT